VQNLRKTKWLLVALVVAVLAPFLHKAFHIDDPLFLWMAQQIARHPLDPYGFSVNWASFPAPMWKEMQNPPLCSYYIAAVASVAGWSEIALHLAYLPWAIMSILGTFSLARRFCREPLTAALLTLFTSVFLVSATNVMCDVMLLALWVWSIELWLAGLEQNRWSLLFVAAFLAAAAAFTKYFGIALVPLLAVYTLTRDWRNWPRLVLFLIPIGAVVGYDLLTASKYGHGLFTGAIFYSRTVSAKLTASFVAQLLTGLSFVGGCLIAALFYAPVRSRKSVLFLLGISASSFAAFYFFLPMNPDWQLGENALAVRIEGGVFAAIGACILALSIVDLAQRRDAQSLLLLLWVIGTFAFATFFNWSITGRTLLPMAPAAAILLMRHVDLARMSFFARAARLSFAALVALVVTVADYQQAGTAREAAAFSRERFKEQYSTVWFQSHWGFQYYMQQWGATPINSLDSEISSGDVIVVPANNTAIVAIPTDKVFPPEQQNFPVLPFVTTMGRGTGAAFYTSVRGPLPWAIDRAPAELYYIARFR
jgi:4-amino-4-deoxy-L-arabinose transferase-like glycosyltransferase